MARAARGKIITLLKTLNRSTGKDFRCQTGFSDISWGKASCNYAKSTRTLTKAKFDVIVKEAQEFVKPTRAQNRTTNAEVIDVDVDEWACLVDNSDSDSN